jgi:hypothetical protein
LSGHFFRQLSVDDESKTIDSQDEQSRGERLRTKPGVSCPQPNRTTFLSYPVALYSRGCCGQVMPGLVRRRSPLLCSS